MPSDTSIPADLARYARQSRFAPLGEEGQRRLGRGRALLCGCGALGSAIANLVARAGVGMLRIVDRDFVELSNLQRQTLFDEADAAACLPKAIAAAKKLRAINSQVPIEPIVADIEPANIEQFCQGVDIILDGTDNFETRFLINDAAVKLGLPWVYGGCVGTEGQTMTIVPGRTACLRCLMPDCPAPGTVPTCQSAGILGPIVGVIASIQASEALKILSGNCAATSCHLTAIDLWPPINPRPAVSPETTATNTPNLTDGTPILRSVDVSRLRDQIDCPCCKRKEFSWLSGRLGSQTALLCGRGAVQLSHPGTSIALDELASKLEGLGRVRRNQYLLRLEVEGCELAVFPDGRAIISGTDDVVAARALYAKYIGN